MCDFGLADYCSGDKRLSEISGTPAYIAPEVIRQRYALPADIWSCGIVLYVLLSPRPRGRELENGRRHSGRGLPTPAVRTCKDNLYIGTSSEHPQHVPSVPPSGPSLISHLLPERGGGGAVPARGLSMAGPDNELTSNQPPLRPPTPRPTPK